MAQRNRTTLKGYFNTGDIPTETQFSDFIDSIHNITDDGSPVTEESLDALTEKNPPASTDKVLIYDGELKKTSAAYFQQIFFAASQEEQDTIFSTYGRTDFPILVIRTDTGTTTLYPQSMTVQSEVTQPTITIPGLLVPESMTVQPDITQPTVTPWAQLYPQNLTVQPEITEPTVTPSGGGGTMELPFSYDFAGSGSMDSSKVTIFSNMCPDVSGGGEITTVPPSIVLDSNQGKITAGTVTGGTGLAVYGFEITDNVTMPSGGLEIKWKQNSDTNRGSGTNAQYSIVVADQSIVDEKIWNGSPNNTLNLVSVTTSEYQNGDGLYVLKLINGSWTDAVMFEDYPSRGTYWYKMIVTPTTITVSKSTNGTDYTSVTSGSHGITFGSVVHIGLHGSFGSSTDPTYNAFIIDDFSITAV